MPGITGQGDTYDLPNYVGELFAVTPTDTPFLSAIGGLTGGQRAVGVIDQWQGFDLRSADKHRQRLEGADAPQAEARTRFPVRNVLEIHQEQVETSYTKQATPGQFAGTGSAHPNAAGLAGMNPVINEHAWQLEQHLRQVARDVEVSFLNGIYQEPADNASPRKTRGILQAVTTNVRDQGTIVGDGASTFTAAGLFTETAHGLSAGDAVVARTISGDAVGVLDDEQVYYVLASNLAANTFELGRSVGGATITFAGNSGAVTFYEPAELTAAMVKDLLQDVYDNGGITQSETATLMVGSSLKRALTYLFIEQKNYQEQSRTVGGVKAMLIQTDFGDLNVMLNRHMPTGALAVISLDECAPRFLEIPGKGHFFVEPLAKTGAAEKDQLYGEIGLRYGNERAHGKINAVVKPAAA